MLRQLRRPSVSEDDKTWRRVLWVVLAIDADMFGLEIVAGVTAHSASLRADALGGRQIIPKARAELDVDVRMVGHRRSPCEGPQ